MHKLILFILAAAAMGAPASSQGAGSSEIPVVYIHAGWLLDRPGQPPRGASTIIVRGGTIAEVRDGFIPAVDDADLIDLSRQFVLPGLIDSHVHITFAVAPGFQLALAQDDPVDYVVAGSSHADAILQAGFTTVRDLASPPRAAAALRDGIDAGRIAGPTIIAAGQMISVTSGHGDIVGFSEAASNGMRGTHYGVTCDGADDCRRAVRAQIRAGADVIKLAATGGVISNVAAGLGRQMENEEIEAIVSTAHRFGRRVAAHAHADEGIVAALRAGVDSVEHGTFVGSDTIDMFNERRTYLVPTLLAAVTAVEEARAGRLPAASAAKALEAHEAAIRNVRRAIAAGVRIAFGTDGGVSPHGQNARELSLLVEAGMTPAQAIRTATSNAADLLDRSSRIGSIEPGKDADIIAVNADPLNDLAELEQVQFVMRQGIVHRRNGERQAFSPR